ncbi:MAG: rhomboid family intramembrane serine protease [Bacteroidetes bacterium]|nr:MAG: rhomboid family intramembrane serine protease [Bacteroidota bacterium]
MLPPIVKNLLIINGLVYLAQISFYSAFGINLEKLLGLHYFLASDFKPYQFISYMFLHGSPAHIFFNMFALWMFGAYIENYWGPRRFLTYYLITGMGAGLIQYLIVHFQISPTIKQIDAFIAHPSPELLQEFVSHHVFRVNEAIDPEMYKKFLVFERDANIFLVNPHAENVTESVVQFMIEYKEYYKNSFIVIGASGAVFGLLLAFGMMFPNMYLYLYFLFPIKAKWFVIGYGLIELISGLSNNPDDNVAHFAHLGGMLFGYILIKFWKKRPDIY